MKLLFTASCLGFVLSWSLLGSAADKKAQAPQTVPTRVAAANAPAGNPPAGNPPAGNPPAGNPPAGNAGAGNGAGAGAQQVPPQAPPPAERAKTHHHRRGGAASAGRQRRDSIAKRLDDIDLQLKTLNAKHDESERKQAEAASAQGPLLEASGSVIGSHEGVKVHDCGCPLGGRTIDGITPSFMAGLGYRNGRFRAGLYGALGPDLEQDGMNVTHFAFGGAISYDVFTPLGVQLRVFRDFYRIAEPPEPTGTSASWSFSGYGFGLDLQAHILRVGRHGLDVTVGGDYAGLTRAGDTAGDADANAKAFHVNLGLRLYFGSDLMGDAD